SSKHLQRSSNRDIPTVVTQHLSCIWSDHVGLFINDQSLIIAVRLGWFGHDPVAINRLEIAVTEEIRTQRRSRSNDHRIRAMRQYCIGSGRCSKFKLHTENLQFRFDVIQIFLPAGTPTVLSVNSGTTTNRVIAFQDDNLMASLCRMFCCFKASSYGTIHHNLANLLARCKAFKFRCPDCRVHGTINWITTVQSADTALVDTNAFAHTLP